MIENTVIAIPARMASVRLPGKPLVEIAGKPMIAHVVTRALEAELGEVIVACDDARIAEVAEQAGAIPVMTGDHHQSGSDRIVEALEKQYGLLTPHPNPLPAGKGIKKVISPSGRGRDSAAVEGEGINVPDIIVNLQGDLPTISPQAIRAAVAPFVHTEADIVTLAALIHTPEERENPNVVKPVVAWHADETEGRALYFTRATAPYGEGTLYHHIGLYAYRRDALMRFTKLPPSKLEQRERLEQLRALENGMKIHVVRVDEVPLGVDTPADVEKAEGMLQI